MVTKLLSISKTLLNGVENVLLRNSFNNIQYSGLVRYTSFFSKLSAEELWKGCTSVSNAGKKRGRGKTVNRKNIKDLNRGQIIGVGKANIIWPGLTGPIIRGREIIQRQRLPEDPDREARLIKMRDEMGTFRRLKLSPIERGWSGAKLPGRSVGPPDPIGEDTFDSFDTKVLEMKTVFNMKGNFGRKRRYSCLSVCGNMNGTAGFALGKAVEMKAAIRKSKNRAGQKLMYIERFNDHTIYHDFFTQFGKTKIFVSQRPEGHGLICHRAIRTICEVIGIKNIYAKIEGSTNLQHIVKAFFLGLLQQKKHEQIAEEKQLHVVEFRKDYDNFPKVVASPSSKCRKDEEISRDEILDFKQYCLDDRIVLKKKKYPPFYASYPSYQKHIKKTVHLKNREAVRTHMFAEYGTLRSFLTDKYPECTPYKRKEDQVD